MNAIGFENQIHSKPFLCGDFDAVADNDDDKT